MRPRPGSGPHGSPPARQVVELACRAPSVHNTQPWLWRIRGDRVELHADRRRQLEATDASGRNLALSCGAAIHHARVAAAALGWPAEVALQPDQRDPDHFASLRLRPGHATPIAHAELDALLQRCTDRRRFTSWPIPDQRMTALAGSVTTRGARVVPVLDVTERFRVELLVGRAMDRQRADARYAAELATWLDHSAEDGVPSLVMPTGDELPRARPSRFFDGTADPSRGWVESTDGLAVVCTNDDSTAAWLHAGEALSELWLRATMEGFSVVPLSQVVEVEETRVALTHDVLDRILAPQILVRIGWQSLGRSQLPRTPRRPVDEVLIR